MNPVNMPLRANTGPVLGRCCQHLASTGPVLATNGMFTGNTPLYPDPNLSGHTELNDNKIL